MEAKGGSHVHVILQRLRPILREFPAVSHLLFVKLRRAAKSGRTRSTRSKPRKTEGLPVAAREKGGGRDEALTICGVRPNRASYDIYHSRRCRRFCWRPCTRLRPRRSPWSAHHATSVPKGAGECEARSHIHILAANVNLDALDVAFHSVDRSLELSRQRVRSCHRIDAPKLGSARQDGRCSGMCRVHALQRRSREVGGKGVRAVPSFGTPAAPHWHLAFCSWYPSGSSPRQ